MKKTRVFWVALAILGATFLLLLAFLTLVPRMGPLTPQDVEAILDREPATPEGLFDALRRCKWSDNMHIGSDAKGYSLYNMNNATEMWGDYFKEYPERNKEIIWYKKANPNQEPLPEWNRRS